ncbi:DNA repair protein RAD50 [Hylaeus volcanicus]|uniref:DNA repair protein RAD50 n=1 Tax=Hylaeus volcanicus TaxID=313075 RepID=UPI0023B876BB|nr:DNA repair protein RAD50 [Hylaeus volcanicus]XP_053973733.1 DNA repair protein RAD50 [Hylaeus volcanicus]XP_053973734.1 DNA repair protein RAD50 [Hylaeus volcanicus]
MSRVRRLSIRGIRNFGDDNEEANIRFSRPLTLILGQNGTGKTTIIEALKFATCGEFPPGSDRGKFFIHDPSLTTTSSVRGVVKAEIIDSGGNIYTICRTIESTKANASMKFKTLDSALSRLNKGSKEVVSITNRCANVDLELTTAMGVTKPILEYVIFCHQEDLSWPFQDGKKLKEKFDEIFDSAAFNKALENITKLSKELQQKVLVLREQKQNAELVVSEVVDKETKLEDHKKRLQNTTTKIADIDQELEPLIAEMKKLQKVDSEYKDLQTEERKTRAEYDITKQQLNRLKENIGEVFEGTMEELMSQIKSYDENLMGKACEITEFEMRLKDIDKEESKVANTLANERVTSGSLQQQIKDQERKVALRNKILNETLSAWNLDNIDSNVSEVEVLALSKRLQERMRELENRVEENRVRRAEEEKQLQKEVDTLRSEYSKIESEKNIKENEVIKTRDEVNKIKLEIMQVGAAANKLNSMESKMNEVKNRLQQLSETMDVDAARKEVLDKTKLRSETDAMLNAVDEEIASLLKQSSLQAELEIHKSSLLSKEKDLEKLKVKHEETIMKLLNINELTETKLRTYFDAAQKKLTNEIESITREIQTEERHSTTLETTISHVENELEKKKKEIESDKGKISSICHYKDFDETLLLQSRKVKDLQDKRGLYAHRSVAYKEYMKQLKETNPCCPLCHRGFEERRSVENLLREMETEMEDHPNRLKECELELKIQQEKYDKMLQLKPVVEKIIQLEENELDKIIHNLKMSKENLTKSRTSITKLKEKKSNPESKLTMCKDIMGDIMLWDKYVDEISKLKQTIDNFQSRMVLAGIKSERSLEEAQSHREELKASVKNIRDDIETLQSKINAYNEKMHNAREEQNTLHEELLKIRSGMQKLKQLKDQQEALFTKEVSLGESVDILRRNVTAAKTELNAGIDKLEKKKKDNWEKHEVDRELLTEGTRRLRELQKVQDEVDAFVYRKIPEALERSESKIKNYQNSINKFVREKSTAEAMINKLKEEINRQEIRKRELSDNILLRKTHENVKSLQQQCSHIEEKLKTINYDEMKEKWQDLQSREEVLLRQKNMAKGNQEELQRAILQYTQELRKELYRQARRHYKSKCIELTVMQEAILNLKAYSTVLDVAMMEYHEERMSTVNRIIKKMWKLVYTGTDTTSIEIRTDATQGVGTKRRTYNYRLVQTKHGHELDMKGRCSAGQRVLASIIIRLALAETFCKDCGILALDEPTTNLDQQNADSLASALAKVVKIRSHQKNFQLLVISHDEKFLFKLAELNSNKGFYELYRKASGYTAVRYCQVETRDHIDLNAIKQEISSDEEANEYSEKSRNRSQESNSSKKSYNENVYHKKRQISDNDREEHTEARASKRRYVLNI